MTDKTTARSSTDVEYESDDDAHAGGLHGSSPAAWTAVGDRAGRFTLGAIAMVIGPNWVLFWISAAIAVTGRDWPARSMQLLGFGARSSDNH